MSSVKKVFIVFLVLAMLAGQTPSGAWADETRGIRNGLMRAVERSGHMLHWAAVTVSAYLATGGAPSGKAYTDATAAIAVLEAERRAAQATLNKQNPPATYDELEGAFGVLWLAMDNLGPAVSSLETLIPPESAPELLILRTDLEKQINAANDWLGWAAAAVADYLKAGGTAGSNLHARAEAAITGIRTLVQAAQAKLNKKNPPATYDELESAFYALGDTQRTLVSALAPVIEATHVLNASAELKALMATADKAAADGAAAMGEYLALGGMPADDAYKRAATAVSKMKSEVQAAQAALVSEGRDVPGGRTTEMMRASRSLQAALDGFSQALATLRQETEVLASKKVKLNTTAETPRKMSQEQMEELAAESRQMAQAFKDAARPQKAAPRVVLTVGRARAYVGGVPHVLDAAPFVKAGRTLVPVRFVGEALGAEVSWAAAERRVVIRDGEAEITLVVGSDRAVVNGAPKALDCPLELVSARVFVPLRFVSEALGAKVDYDAGQITING